MRLPAPVEFVDQASCLDLPDDQATTADDAITPAVGITYYYLACAKNGCGHGSLGGDRTARDCPAPSRRALTH